MRAYNLEIVWNNPTWFVYHTVAMRRIGGDKWEHSGNAHGHQITEFRPSICHKLTEMEWKNTAENELLGIISKKQRDQAMKARALFRKHKSAVKRILFSVQLDIKLFGKLTATSFHFEQLKSQL